MPARNYPLLTLVKLQSAQTYKPQFEEKNRVEILDGYALILAVPTMISGMYGMNVDSKWVPLARTANGFGIIDLVPR